MDSLQSRKLKRVVIAVRDYGQALTRAGDLGDMSTAQVLPITDLGREIHEAIQTRLSMEDANYQPEVSLRHSVRMKRYELRIVGRADGVTRGDSPLIEEIKSSFNLERLERTLHAQHPYILQTQLYGYFYWLEHRAVPGLQLRLVNTQTLREKVIPVEFELEAFAVWFKARAQQIEAALLRYDALQAARKKLGAKLSFPFAAPRAQQVELIERIGANLEEGKSLLLQAPTGLGKTAGVLFPALKYALSRGAPVVYLAPKNSQFQAAVELAKKFHKAKVGLKVLVVTSKAKACQGARSECTAEACANCARYYDKVEDHKLAGRDKKNVWDFRYFQKLADTFAVCPYELSMERVREADLIICDYNYVFSPRGNFFDRYLDPIVPHVPPLLVVDEAHNLYERVMENYSPGIKLSDLKAFLDRARMKAESEFAAVLDSAIQLMKAIAPREPQAKVDLEAEAVQGLLDDSLGLMMERWAERGLPAPEDDLFQFYMHWLELRDMLDLPRESVPLLYKREAGDEILKAQCIDPSAIIAPLHEKFLAVVAFSATLKPFAFYQHMSGFPKDRTEAIEFASPFPRENKKIMIIPQVKTNYRERNQHYARIASIIERIASVEPGAYLAFFPSYDFLRQIESRLPKGEGFAIFAQTGGLSHAQLQTVLALFRQERGVRLILGVQGGSLAEGIDFRGLGLKGVFVIGPAMPSATYERALMQEHFEKILGGDGRSYAYVYPSMSKSVQSAGRVVRDEEERGVIILLDPRFLDKDFEETMPSDWFETSAQELVSSEILNDIRAFWQREGDDGALPRDGGPSVESQP